jgi:hypothetical protein
MKSTLAPIFCFLFFYNLVWAETPSSDLPKKNASKTGRFALATALDLLKSDFDEPLDKLQLGVEAHYFVLNKVAFSGGLEFWRRGNGGVTPIMLGTRVYIVDPVFVRGRVLLANNNAEFAFGGGYSHKIASNWRFEGMGDYFVDAGEFALRVGILYLF